MNASLELYRIFACVARTGSFTAAANELYITQPAVSQAMRKLENALTTTLFVRSGKGLTLTHEGETLYGYVSSALTMLEAGERRMHGLGNLTEGELRIGASDTVSKWYLLPVISRFHEMYPKISLSVTNRTSSETLELLSDGQIDIGFVNMPITAKQVAFEICTDVHDVFIAGKAFEHLRGKTLSPQELCGYPLIMLERAANSRRWVDRHFTANRAPLVAQIELGAHDLLPDYAGIGLGIACVIEEFVDLKKNDELFVVQLEPPVPTRSIGACYRENIELSAAARRFIDLAKQHGYSSSV